MQRWTWLVSNDRRAIATRTIRASALLIVGLLLSGACGTPAADVPVANSTPAPQSTAATDAKTINRSPASTAHCQEIAAQRADDAKWRGYDKSIQDNVQQTAFAECIRWASP